MKCLLLGTILSVGHVLAAPPQPSEIFCQGVNSKEEARIKFTTVKNENGTTWTRAEMLLFNEGEFFYDDLDMRLRTTEATDSQGGKTTIYLIKERVFLNTIIAIELSETTQQGRGSRTYEADGLTYRVRYNCWTKH